MRRWLDPRFSRARSAAGERGFTLAELMVAITAGMLVAASAFALAKQGSRFFQQEYRIANAQYSAAAGFARLRADLARAAYLGEPNIQRNGLPFSQRGAGSRCGLPSPSWPAGLRSLAAVQLVAATPAESQDATNGLSPDQIVLAGSYASSELFPIAYLEAAGPTYQAWLETTAPTLIRASGGDLNNLKNIFQANRILRIVDNKGYLEYGVIQGFTVSGTRAYIVLDGTKTTIPFVKDKECQGGAGGIGMQASVINLIRYDVRNVPRDGAYAPLFASTATGPGDETRHELVRVELDADGNEIANTLEIVAEYAVDLRFAFTVVTDYGATGSDPSLQAYGFGDANNYLYGADVATNAATPGPERIRSVRARLTVRSREADRSSNIPRASTIFRYQIPGTSTFARARTLTGEAHLTNLDGVTW